MQHDALRLHLVRLLTWSDAHPSFDEAVADLDPAFRGRRPPGAPYSPWQLLEHLRRAQFDILDFCQNSAYKGLSWPDDYWPEGAEPPTKSAWDESVAAFDRDLAELVRLAENESIDLFATIPHGSGQTYLREVLLVADHNAYHLGELVVVRRMLGAWRS